MLYDFSREGGKEFTDEDAARVNRANGVDFSKREDNVEGENKEMASKETVSPSEKMFRNSVASNDADANLAKNLDKRKESYKNRDDNKTRGFISDIARDLRLEHHEASQYGTFTAKDGKAFTFRLSNHNANAATFDKNGEQEGISIVISSKKNKGIRGRDAKVHATEFFYPKKAIENAEGKPLVSIIDSIKEMLGTGEYVDRTGLARRDEINGPASEERDYSRREDGVDRSKREDGDAVSRVVSHVAEVSKKTGAGVKMVGSADEVTSEKAKRRIDAGEKVRGWYDEKTGEVCLYMPNVRDKYTAEKTVWHETVGHKGMRGLLGEAGYRKWLRGLWYDLDDAAYAGLHEYVRERMAKDHLSIYDAIEEYVSDAAENGKGEPGFWNRMTGAVTDALREAGYRVNPNVKDVQYMLWLAKNVQKHPDDPAWKMRAEAVRWKSTAV